MMFLLKLLFITALALVLPVMGLFVLGHSGVIGLGLMLAPMVIAYYLV